MEFSNKRVLVIGLGKSGIAASKKLRTLGARVLASDISQTDAMLKLADELQNTGVDVKLGQQDESLLNEIELVVVSPGVPSRVSVLEAARRKGIPVWSEIELAYRLTDKPMIAITGTNGKTTTTTLIGKVFKAAGKRAEVAGNIGNPLVSAIDNANVETLIVEVSSFQLDTIVEFRPSIAVLLNITEDHLDWHPDFDDYVRAKHRLFMNQLDSDFAVVNIDDEVTKTITQDITAKVIATSKAELQEGICIRDSHVVARLQNTVGISEDISICAIDEIRIRGEHNLDNVMAVIGVCLVAGIDPKVIKDVITSFPGLAHRVEFVASIDGVAYFNDSKATNVDATIKALTAFSEPVILLVGGRNKGNDFKPLAQSINKRVKAVIGFGEAGQEILSAMPESVLLEYVETVDDAVKLASKLALPGHIVLFSPSCASFDAFKSYTHRGETFKQAVLSLGEKNGERETEQG